MNARSYGAKSWTVKTDEELHQAFKDMQDSPVTTLIDVKTFVKSMTDGYESWWRVGIPEVSNHKAVVDFYKKQQEEIKQIRQF